MQVAIAVASLYDVTISATESQFGQKAKCINTIELCILIQMGPAINLLICVAFTTFTITNFTNTGK